MCLSVRETDRDREEDRVSEREIEEERERERPFVSALFLPYTLLLQINKSASMLFILSLHTVEAERNAF